jgi:hypothetical protein
MTWNGRWKNQFGSVVEIREESHNKISGTFTTALKDSAFFGQTVPIIGTYQGSCISFAAAATTKFGDVVVSYTGLLRDSKLETMWFAVADRALTASEPGAPAQLKEQKWWRAVITNMDTFERSV